MLAISFDMKVADLERYYGKSYTSAYYKIRRSLESDNFYWLQGSTYAVQSDDLMALFIAIQHLKEFDWFCKSIRDIRGFRMENWSDFTSYFKGE